MKKVIEVSHLSKIFGSFKAVDDISFEVYEGEIFGFLGANGAGKTTAIKVLCGLSTPSLGSVSVAGYDAKKQSEKIKENIGYMSQKFSLYKDLSVLENMCYFGKIYKMSDEDIILRSKELLHRLEFEDKKDELVSRLPLGWKQKLAFCVANFHRPKIIFLDEPTGGVDPITRRQFWQLIYEAAKDGTCIFITTHYMDEAEYCDRLSIMVDGKIKLIGTPKELKTEFKVGDINELFYQVAKRAKRQ